MQKNSLLLFAILVWLATATVNAQQPEEKLVDQDALIVLGMQRELFVDGFILEDLDGARLKLHHPVEGAGKLPFDKPWEGAFSGYATFIKDGDVYRMYYRGLPEAGADGSEAEVTCYALSLDGATWHKPDLGIYEFDGSTNNNIVLSGHAPASHNFAPFLDTNPNAKIDQRYKALGGGAAGLIAFTSPDGIHWNRVREEPVFTKGVFDSQNVSFWSESEQQYVCYFRTWTRDGYSGKRTISRTTSMDFLEWTDPQPMSFGDTPIEHLYTNQTSPYFRAPHICVALAARFMPGRRVISHLQATDVGVNQRYFNDCSDSVLLTTRGGYEYDRTFMESFIRPGLGPENWVSRSNYAANGIAPIDQQRMSLYMSRNYGQPTSYLQQYVLRTDGFSSIYAGYAGGTATTKLITIQKPSEEVLKQKKKRWLEVVAEKSKTVTPAISEDAIFGNQSLNVSEPVSLELPETQSLGNSFTLAASVKNVPGGHRRLFSAYNGGSTAPGELILDFNSAGNIADDGAIRFFWDDFKLTAGIEATGDWSSESGDNSAHHIALTWENGDAKLFFDGKLIASDRSEKHADVELSLGNLRFGEDLAPTSLNNEPFVGIVDDILVLKRALSDEQVTALAQTGALNSLAESDLPDRDGVLLMMEDSVDWTYSDQPAERVLDNAFGDKPVTLPPLAPVEIKARELEINMATSAAGSIRVAMLDSSGQPIAGFSLDDCDLIIGDQISRVVTWRGGYSDISSLCEQPVRFVFELKDADIYSMMIR